MNPMLMDLSVCQIWNEKSLTVPIGNAAPVRPQKFPQKLIQSLCTNSNLRGALDTTFVILHEDDGNGVIATVKKLKSNHLGKADWSKKLTMSFHLQWMSSK